jgi:hypothetical protein
LTFCPWHCRPSADTAGRTALGPHLGRERLGKAVHRVVADSITPEEAVDEAIARIKEILAE